MKLKSLKPRSRYEIRDSLEDLFINKLDRMIVVRHPATGAHNVELYHHLDTKISEPMRLMRRIRDMHMLPLKHFIKNESKKLKKKSLNGSP